MLTDTDKKFELEAELLNILTNINHNFHLAKVSDEKLTFDFAKETFFDEKASGNKSVRDENPIRLLQSPAIMAGSLKKMQFSNPNDTKKLLLNFVEDEMF